MLCMLLSGGGHRNGAPPANPRTTHRLAPELLLEWQEGVAHLLDVEEGAGSQGHLRSCWEAPGLSTGWVLTAETCLRAQWGCLGGRGPEPVTHHLPAPPPSRVSRVSLPPATKGRALTRPPVECTGDLAPGWGLVTWWCLLSPSKMPVPSRRARAQHKPHGWCRRHRCRGLPLMEGRL